MFKASELIDPDERPAADIVIFDGKCNFCQGQVERLNWFDRGARLAFLSLHDRRVAERFPQLSYDDLMQQMYVIDSDNQAHGGSEAVRYLSRRLPLLWPLAPLLHLPGTSGLWRWAYLQVARRRYRLAGEKCDNDGCQIHIRGR